MYACTFTCILIQRTFFHCFQREREGEKHWYEREASAAASRTCLRWGIKPATSQVRDAVPTNWATPAEAITVCFKMISEAQPALRSTSILYQHLNLWKRRSEHQFLVRMQAGWNGPAPHPRWSNNFLLLKAVCHPKYNVHALTFWGDCSAVFHSDHGEVLCELTLFLSPGAAAAP